MISSVLEDLVEIDSLIRDLEGCDYVLSVNAYITLKIRCSQNWEAFKYLQGRMHSCKIILLASYFTLPVPLLYFQQLEREYS